MGGGYSELWVGVLEGFFSNSLKKLAGTTGLEPAASAVTGQRSNQLNYVPSFLGNYKIFKLRLLGRRLPEQLD
jgi:hypothetical protein